MDDFESRLRAFKPRQPGPLPQPSKQHPAWWLLGAAAAVIAMTVVVRDFSPARSAVVVQGFSPARNVATIGALTPLALGDPAAFDAALDRMSQTLLPDVEQPNHALSALGKESK